MLVGIAAPPLQVTSLPKQSQIPLPCVAALLPLEFETGH